MTPTAKTYRVWTDSTGPIGVQWYDRAGVLHELAGASLAVEVVTLTGVLVAEITSGVTGYSPTDPADPNIVIDFNAAFETYGAGTYRLRIVDTTGALEPSADDVYLQVLAAPA